MDAEENNNASNETAEAVEQHSSFLNEKLKDILSDKDSTAYHMSEELFNRKIDCVKRLQGGAAPGTLWIKGFPQAYDWANKYDIIHIGSKDTLVYTRQLQMRKGNYHLWITTGVFPAKTIASMM